MGNYLNPGNDMFYKMVHSEIYVDKTGLIGYCNHVINTMQRQDSEYEDYFAFRSPLEKNAQWSGPEGEHR